MAKTKVTTIDQYIQAAAPEAQPKLREIREILRKVAPRGVEAIKWGSPVIEENRILFSFSAHKKHINFMPTHSSLEPFQKELEGFTTGKDTLQIPYDKPTPKTLIRKIAEHRVRDVRENDSHWMKKRT